MNNSNMKVSKSLDIKPEIKTVYPDRKYTLNEVFINMYNELHKDYDKKAA